MSTLISTVFCPDGRGHLNPETKQLDFSGLSYFSKDLNRQARERRDQFFAAETRQAEEAKKKSDDEARKRMTDGVL